MRSSGLQKGRSIGTFSKEAKAIVNLFVRTAMVWGSPILSPLGQASAHGICEDGTGGNGRAALGLDFAVVNSRQSILQQKDRGTRRLNLICIVDSCPLGVFRLKLLPRHLMQ